MDIPCGERLLFPTSVSSMRPSPHATLRPRDNHVAYGVCRLTDASLRPEGCLLRHLSFHPRRMQWRGGVDCLHAFCHGLQIALGTACGIKGADFSAMRYCKMSPLPTSPTTNGISQWTPTALLAGTLPLLSPHDGNWMLSAVSDRRRRSVQLLRLPHGLSPHLLGGSDTATGHLGCHLRIWCPDAYGCSDRICSVVSVRRFPDVHRSATRLTPAFISATFFGAGFRLPAGGDGDASKMPTLSCLHDGCFG